MFIVYSFCVEVYVVKPDLRQSGRVTYLNVEGNLPQCFYQVHFKSSKKKKKQNSLQLRAEISEIRKERKIGQTERRCFEGK